MLDLSEIPFFSTLSPAALDAVRDLTETRNFAADAVVCRRGDPGEAFHAVASGAVTIGLSASNAGRPTFYLGPGEVFGEMSLLSDMPVSAMVIAAEETCTYALPKPSFLLALETHPPLRAALADMLVRRMRHRTSTGSAEFAAPGCVMVELSSDSPALRSLGRAIGRGVQHYAPGSSVVDPAEWSRDASPADESPADESSGGWQERFDGWRDTATNEQYFVAILEHPDAAAHQHLHRRDILLRLHDATDSSVDGTAAAGALAASDADSASATGLVDTATVVFGPRGATPRDTGRWSFRVEPAEVERIDEADWVRERYPTIDWIARWITRREVGIALGAGAARGFAHLGVLAVLEEAGLPIDYVCGSSIGGIVALIYAKSGSASQAIDDARRYLAGNSKLREFRWFPRSALLGGSGIERAARSFADDLTFAELERPAAAIAADLAGGQRVVLDSGSVARAIVATSAIPGLLPPVAQDGKLMVDGALVSRIPADLLDRRRCGLKIAVNVVPSPGPRAGIGRQAADELTRKVNRFLGMREVLARSWELLGWWHGAAEAEGVDILVEPVTRSHPGYDFDAIDQMIGVGRAATERKLEMIKEALHAMLTPGTP